MGVLIKNEFYKLKREWFMVFLLLLSLLPIITGGAGAIFNSSTKSLWIYVNTLDKKSRKVMLLF